MRSGIALLRVAGSLRARLALAFALITLLSIVLVGVMALFLLRDREIAAATQRTGDLLPPEAMKIGGLVQSGYGPEYLAAFLRSEADKLNVRFILLDSSDQVIVDTAGKLSGQFVAPASTRRMRSVPNSYTVTAYQEGGISYYLYLQPPDEIAIQGRRTLIPRTYRLAMLVPEGSITSAWEDLAPRLIVAGAIALVLSLAVAALIARTITRPLKRITQASQRMAAGMYDQQLPVDGPEEVASLAASFNVMARQVARSHQMMRDLLANVAHELKTPLTSIQGFSQALADGTVQSPEEFATAARIINEESERMRRLVEDLLYLSQIESGQLALERQPVEVATLFASSVERIQFRLEESGKTLTVDCPPSLPPINADARRIEQVLANLLDNALRHTPPGGTITLQATRQGGRVALSVHNTGSYIPPEALERVFERFYQVDRSRSRSGRNGGLGLAIAREIVAAHGGEIYATSDPESGTTFTVLLDAAFGRSASALPVASREPQPAGAIA